MRPSRREFVAAGVAAQAVRPPGDAAASARAPLPAAGLAALVRSSAPDRWKPAPADLAPAKWIWPACERTLPNTFVLFRKDFTLQALPASATALIAADSRYRLTVNGRRAQWGPAPCDPRALDVDPVDLAPFLRPGRNAIGVEVLFYGHGDGTWPGGKPGLLFWLEAGGGVVASDDSWLCRVDRAHRPGMYKRWFLRALQEEFDARRHPHGWTEVEYRAGAEWVKPAVLACPADKPPSCAGGRMWAGDTVQMVAQPAASLRLRQIPASVEREVPAARLAHAGRVEWLRDPDDWFEMRAPGSFRIARSDVAREMAPAAWELAAPAPGHGVYAVFELSEQVVGWPHVTVDAPEGAIVEMLTQESHDPARASWLDTHHFSWSRYVCREGENRCEPFDYESLRWIQVHVRNASRPVRVREIGVRRKLYDWPVEPRIRCSEAPLQRLFDAGVNTLRNSAIETLVDGMGRERQQYSGDGGHQLHAVRYAFGDTRICRRYLRTFSEGLAKDGYFMDSWPAYDRLARVAQKQIDAAYWGPLLDHGVGFVFDCWNHWFETGEKEALEEPWPRLVRFAEYMEKTIGPDGLLPVENLGIPTVWIDHSAYRQARHKQCAFNLYTAAMFEHALGPLAELMGDARKAAHARQTGARLRAATVRRYWSGDRGMFVDNLPWLAEEKAVRLSDRALATSILFRQCPGGSTAAAVRALSEAPRELGISYPCNAGWRYWALAAGGRGDVVLRELRQKWATMASVKLNNTLQEFWTATPDSGQQWSHCALAPIFVLYMDIAGIRPLAPGFSRCRIRPQLGDLPDLDLTAQTVRGPLTFQAVRERGGHRVKVSLPAGCAAEAALPDGSRQAIATGTSATFFVPGGSNSNEPA